MTSKIPLKMVAGGIQPNWRHIFLGLVILAVIWYAFHGSKVNTKYIQEGILAKVIKKYICISVTYYVLTMYVRNVTYFSILAYQKASSRSLLWGMVSWQSTVHHRPSIACLGKVWSNCWFTLETLWKSIGRINKLPLFFSKYLSQSWSKNPLLLPIF